MTGDIPPQLNGPTIQVVNGILYLFGGEVSSATEDSIIYFNDCYKLDLTSLVWSKLDLASKYDSRYFTGSAVIGSDLVLLYGWSNYLNDDARNIMKLSLENPIGWEEASLSESCSSVDSFAYATIDGSIYIFGGYVDGIYVNSMVKITDWVCTLVNDVDLSPPARMYHSLATINSKVYMYGGQGFDGKLEDMWEFNTNTLLWNAIKIEGLSPGARSSYSCASEGDIMIIWGGESSSSYLNDMYQFNAFDSSWKLISPTGIIPSARSGACIAMALPKIYIFGGKTTSGISNELWEYDTSLNEYLLLYSDGKGVKPDPVVFPTCEIVDGNFLVIFGTSDGEVPNSTAFLFNVTELLWTEVFYQDFSLFSRSLAVVKYLSGKVLVIGGQAWSTDPYKDSYLVDLATGEQVYLKSLPEYYYAGGFTMFKKNIYIFGGGSLIGNTMRVSVPSYNFFMYDLSDFGSPCPVICSKGSYDENGVCNECIAGSYTDLSGESICTPCSSGTYNYNDGANSVRQCYPCDQGTYAPHNGTKLCYICPNGYYCPIGSSTYFNSELASSSSSTQPPNYVANIAELNTKKSYLYISLSFVLIGLLVALRFIKYTKRILPILDLFKTEHNYTLNQPMVMVKNMIGGFFSVLFLLVAVLLIVSALLEYNINNIIESKALVPLVILENTTPTFTGQIEIDLTFYSYGGDCVDSTGNVLAKLTYVNLAYTYMKVSGSKNGEDCIISLVCSTCQVQTGAYIYYTFQEKSSYCSAFAVNIKAESSIPLSYSSISETVISGTNTVFRGYLATEFNILATPSSYEPASSSSAQVATGYHMSLDSNAVPGTTFYISE